MTAVVLNQYFLHKKTLVVHRHDCALLKAVPAGRLQPIDVERLGYVVRCCSLCTPLHLPAPHPARRVGELSADRLRFVRCRELAANMLELLELVGIRAAELSAFVARIPAEGASAEQREELAELLYNAGVGGDASREEGERP